MQTYSIFLHAKGILTMLQRIYMFVQTKQCVCTVVILRQWIDAFEKIKDFASRLMAIKTRTEGS